MILAGIHLHAPPTLLCITVLYAGCIFDVTPIESGDYLCDTDDDCRWGWRCVVDGNRSACLIPDVKRYDHGVGPSTVLGDWFTCKIDNCSTLDNDGMQLKTGGSAIGLVAPGETLEPKEPYCEVSDNTGTFKWSSPNLEVYLQAGTMKGSVDTKAGIFTMTWMSLPGGGNLISKPVYMKQIVSRTTGACK